MYRTAVPAEALAENSELTFSGSVNDVATVREMQIAGYFVFVSLFQI